MSDTLHIMVNAHIGGCPPPGECGPVDRELAEMLLARGSAVDCSSLEARHPGATASPPTREARDTISEWPADQPAEQTSTSEPTSGGRERPSTQDPTTSGSDTEERPSSTSPKPPTSDAKTEAGKSSGSGKVTPTKNY